MIITKLSDFCDWDLAKICMFDAFATLFFYIFHAIPIKQTQLASILQFDKLKLVWKINMQISDPSQSVL